MLKSTVFIVACFFGCLWGRAAASDLALSYEFAPAGGWKGRRAAPSLSECHLNYTTDVWTACASILSQFNITLAYFQYANPEVGENCENFVPGNTYCIFRASQTGKHIGVSTDGLCGAQQNWTNTCVGSGFGDCCGSGGYCGSSEEYCGEGNCQEGSCDGGKAFSTDGRCGADFSYLECPNKFGLCCSQYGNCGNDADFCGTGCQSGPCLASSKVTSSTILPTSTSQQPPLLPGSISSDGTCGYTNQLVCRGSKFGDCCSAAGYCGRDLYHCGQLLGCQSDFGTCNKTAAANSTTLPQSTGMTTMNE